MRFNLLCPACGVREIDFDQYESMVLLAPNLALMQFSCPGCGIHLSATIKLSPEMQRIVQKKLNSDGSEHIQPKEMKARPHAPDPSRLSYASNLVVDEGDYDIEIIRPLRTGAIDLKAHLEDFKRKLDTIETVDEAIEEIDTGFHHERRDV